MTKVILTRHGLASTSGMADVDGVPQIKMLAHGRRVSRVVVHVVAFADLTRAPMPAPVFVLPKVAKPSSAPNPRRLARDG